MSAKLKQFDVYSEVGKAFNMDMCCQLTGTSWACEIKANRCRLTSHADHMFYRLDVQFYNSKYAYM